MRFRRRAPMWAAVSALLLSTASAQALGSGTAKSQAQNSISFVERSLGTVQTSMSKASAKKLTPEKRIANGEIFLRNKDYDRAIGLFEQVVELHSQGKASVGADANARYWLGEAYFQDKQYLSAKRHFRYLAEKGASPAYAQYAGRALSRMIDVALRTDKFDKLDEIFALINKLPASDQSGSLQYARGKAFFAKKELAASRSALAQVSASSDWAHQAQYLLGAVMVKEAAPPPPPPTPVPGDGAAIDPKTQTAAPPVSNTKRYAQAINQFKKVTQLSPDTFRHRHVIDLAWMAIGRLFYESDNYLDAADAYSHVDRRSPEFTTMLYELSWVYVRLGDYRRAQRALEVLNISKPKGLNTADSTLLQADLLLRSGQYKKALGLYNKVRDEYDPIRDQVADFLRNNQDPAVYYDALTGDEMEVTADGKLPKKAVAWAREAAEGDRVFSLIDDVRRSRDLIKRSNRMVRLLNGVLATSTRARAFPELKAGLEATLGLLNRLAHARRDLALGLDDEYSGTPGGELGQVVKARRKLMKRLGHLPVTPGDFSRREAAGEKQWNKVSQKLQRLTLSADALQAMVNGLRRILKDSQKYGVNADAASRQRFQAEVAANERDLANYRKQIKAYRQALEMGRSQIGFGDQRFVVDDRVRAEFRKLFAREVQLAAAGSGGSSAQSYARSIQSIVNRADTVEAKLEATRAKLEKQVESKASELKKKIDREAVALKKYTEQLGGLDDEARVLVGEVAKKNFAKVRDRLKSVVLRADVGVVQQAWEVREEAKRRVISLQRERAREEQNLNDELREVLDDAGEDQ